MKSYEISIFSGYLRVFPKGTTPPTAPPRGKNAELGPCDDPVAFAQFAGILHLGQRLWDFFMGNRWQISGGYPLMSTQILGGTPPIFIIHGLLI